MEGSINKGDLQGYAVRTPLSGKSTARYSPSFRRLHSSQTPLRESRIGGASSHWFRNSNLVYWLLLITLWAYLGLYFQSKWASGDNGEVFLGFGKKQRTQNSVSEQSQRRNLGTGDNSLKVQIGIHTSKAGDDKRIDVVLAKRGTESSNRKGTLRRRTRRGTGRKARIGEKRDNGAEDNDNGANEPDVPMNNSTYGMLVGPFGSVEDRILEWSPEKRLGTCDRKGDFARLVWSRKFLLIFHELSLTGAPLSMLELATELLSCGATVKVVDLNKKGGLMPELARKRIKVLEDKGEASFKTAMKVDLVIAGSAVCASWIEQYFNYHPAGASQIAWWIMENRQEYFDRAKVVLSRVKMLVFLSEMQSKQWLTWCEEEKIKLRYVPALVPLSVNDEMAFVAGFNTSLNTPTFTTEKMLEKKQMLRNFVRKEMGLADNDMLVISLSSINPGKGQLLLLESASLIINQGQAKSALERSTMELGQVRGQTINVLIGSVGSKSNKPEYVKGILSFLSEHSDLSNSVRWTPATTRVASLYSAADVYVTNSQGVGETFGRVTIEAMAFGLPVLGTDAGGTREIVDQNVTGLLHPVGRPGTDVLTRNLQFLLHNQTARKQLGMEGRKKVERMYLKRHMYKRFVDVLTKCMRP